MSDAEIQEEWNYIRDERLGMLCEDRKPTLSERLMAVKDANAWVQQMVQDEKTC